MVGSVVLAGRAAAERLMVDRCVIRRPTGEYVTDPDTHEVFPEFDVIYVGKCKIATYEAFEQERESAGLTQIINRVRVDIPVGAAETLPNDVVTLLESNDPMLVG
ncbi:MAG TPA: DUF6093 family protein, partial [Jiangellaceae bacterium]|nr:DUF6093 family protein [Jiangellaceae bacterium]